MESGVVLNFCKKVLRILLGRKQKKNIRIDPDAELEIEEGEEEEEEKEKEEEEEEEDKQFIKETKRFKTIYKKDHIKN